MTREVRLSLGLLAGLVHALASSGHPLVAWGALPLLCHAQGGASRREALAVGALFGAAGGIEIFCVASYGALALLIMLASHVTLCVLQSLALRELRARSRGWTWLAPLAWVAIEWAWAAALGRLYAPVPAGFGLLASPPLAQLAAHLGLPGLSAAVVLAGALAQPTGGSTRTRLVRALAVPIALWAYGTLRLQHEPAPARVLRVASVQGAVPQWAYESARYLPALEAQIWERYAAPTRALPPGEVDLVVWPETALRPARARQPETRAALMDLAKDLGGALLVGIAESEVAARDKLAEVPSSAAAHEAGTPVSAHNRALLIPPAGAVQQGDKRWLIPILEREWQRSPDPIVFTHEGLRIGVLICVESVYPTLSEAFRAPPIDLLVVLANDVALGPGGQQFHGLFGALRALELGVPVIHAAQGGASRIFDARGRLLAAAEPGEALLRSTLPLPAARTPDAL